MDEQGIRYMTPEEEAQHITITLPALAIRRDQLADADPAEVARKLLPDLERMLVDKIARRKQQVADEASVADWLSGMGGNEGGK